MSKLINVHCLLNKSPIQTNILLTTILSFSTLLRENTITTNHLLRLRRLCVTLIKRICLPESDPEPPSLFLGSDSPSTESSHPAPATWSTSPLFIHVFGNDQLKESGHTNGRVFCPRGSITGYHKVHCCHLVLINQTTAESCWAELAGMHKPFCSKNHRTRLKITETHHNTTAQKASNYYKTARLRFTRWQLSIGWGRRLRGALKNKFLRLAFKVFLI